MGASGWLPSTTFRPATRNREWGNISYLNVNRGGEWVLHQERWLGDGHTRPSGDCNIGGCSLRGRITYYGVSWWIHLDQLYHLQSSGQSVQGNTGFGQTADFYPNGICSTASYRKILYRSLESGHVIYVVFISFLYILLVLSHGLIGVKVPGSTCKGVWKFTWGNKFPKFFGGVVTLRYYVQRNFSFCSRA